MSADTNRRRLGALFWITSALTLYIGFLAATTPATVLARAAAAATDDAVVLEGATGSVWNGSATRVRLVDSSGRVHSFRHVRWEAPLAHLVDGRLVTRLEIDDPVLKGSAQLALRLDGAEVIDVNLRAPVSLIAAQVPGLAALDAAGDVTVRARKVLLTTRGAQGTATIEVHGSRSSTAKPLGEYRTIFSGSEARLDFRVETVRGPLRFEGQGAWKKGQAISFEAAGLAAIGTAARE